MQIQAVKIACFSPTGTTRAIARAIARGLRAKTVDLIDLTSPEARKIALRTHANDLLIVAVPVYMGRVPALLAEWLGALHADRTPSVGVVVYGNRAYEDALLELKEALSRRGCIPMAGSAWIGEHSFSSRETPVAEGRPDASDLLLAESFGSRIAAKLQAASSVEQLVDVSMPGTYPYRGITKLWDVDFIAVSDACTRCGVCAAGCPMGAIDPEDSHTIDQVACITCCACIKSCPQHARTMKPGPVKNAALRLTSLYPDRKTPDLFL